MKILNKINKFKKNHKKEKQNLPTLFFFTDRKQFNDIFTIIKKLPQNSAIIIREYDLNQKERLKFAKKIVKIAKYKNLLTFAAKSLKLAVQAKTDGVHFSDNDKSWMKYLFYKKFNQKFFLSCSCHNQKSINKIKEFPINFAFLSPIFDTKTHPNQKAIGHRNLIKLQNHQSAIYALGGVNENNIKLLQNRKIKGVGAISLLTKI